MFPGADSRGNGFNTAFRPSCGGKRRGDGQSQRALITAPAPSPTLTSRPAAHLSFGACFCYLLLFSHYYPLVPVPPVPSLSAWFSLSKPAPSVSATRLHRWVLVALFRFIPLYSANARGPVHQSLPEQLQVQT